MKRIAVALGVLTVLVLAAPAGAELCEKCKGGTYIMSVGKCVECGGFTGSGAHKLCRKCSAKLGQCEHCRAPLKKAAKQGATTKPVTHPNAKGWGPVVAGVRMRLVTDSGRIVEGELPKLAVVVENNSDRPIFFERGGGKLPIFRYATLWNCNTAGREKQIAYLRKNPGPHAPSPFGPSTEGVPPGKSVHLETIDAMSLMRRLTKTYPQKLVAVTNFYTSKKERWNLTSNILEIHLASLPAYLAPLKLDASHNGKTVSATVGQEIVIRLKGNATTGYSWVVGKVEGDALGQVGKVKYVSDQPPMPAGGRGRGLMRHKVGGGGKYVFTFRATKAGKAKLTLEYKRGWEKDKPPAKTFALTVNVKADPTADRVKKLKADINSFTLMLRYHGPKGKPLYRSLVLSVPQMVVDAVPGFNYLTISRKQAEKIIDHLADEGFLGKARDITKAMVGPPRGPCYVMQLYCTGAGRLRLDLGWDLKMLNRLDSLQKVLDGDAAKAMDKLLKRLEGQRKEWEKKTPVKKS